MWRQGGERSGTIGASCEHMLYSGGEDVGKGRTLPVYSHIPGPHKLLPHCHLFSIYVSILNCENLIVRRAEELMNLLPPPFPPFPDRTCERKGEREREGERIRPNETPAETRKEAGDSHLAAAVAAKGEEVEGK